MGVILSNGWKISFKEASALGTVRRASRSQRGNRRPIRELEGASPRRSVLLETQDRDKAQKRSPGTPIEGGAEEISSLIE